MERHKNKWITTHDDEQLILDIAVEQRRGARKFGVFYSAHEMASVIREEFEEFWDSVKSNDPDPKELLHIIATAKRALIELCEQARTEILKGE